MKTMTNDVCSLVLLSQPFSPQCTFLIYDYTSLKTAKNTHCQKTSNSVQKFHFSKNDKNCEFESQTIKFIILKFLSVFLNLYRPFLDLFLAFLDLFGPLWTFLGTLWTFLDLSKKVPKWPKRAHKVPKGPKRSLEVPKGP